MPRRRDAVDGAVRESETRTGAAAVSRRYQSTQVVIDKDKKDAAVVKEKVLVQEASATEISERAGAIAADAQADLDKALPALAAAVQCLKELKKAHIDEVKALKKPPGGVRLTLEVACVFFEARRAASESPRNPSLMETSRIHEARAPEDRGNTQVAPVKKPDPEDPSKKILDYVEPAGKSLLSNAGKFLEMLQEFDKDNIPDKVRPRRPLRPVGRRRATPRRHRRSSRRCSRTSRTRTSRPR